MSFGVRGKEEGRRGRTAARAGGACGGRVVLLSITWLALGCGSENQAGSSEAAKSVAAASSPVSQPIVSSSRPGATAIAPADPQGCMVPGCHDNFAKLTYRHGPLQAGACDSCHEPEQPGHKFPMKRPGVATCTFCHQVTGHAAFTHTAITQQGCLPCHDPHGSNTKFLLTDVSVELTCRHCHKLERKADLHAPFGAGQCTACHNPHEADNRMLLLGGGGAKHCLSCHAHTEQRLEACSYVHQPLEQGCLPCHQPHSSDVPRLLNAPLDELCFSCHLDVQATVAGARFSHGAVSTVHRCVNCHDPHAAGFASLLRDDQMHVCLTCHNQPQSAPGGRTIPDMRPVLVDRRFKHGPVQAGQCNACHDVHGAAYSRLLKANYTDQFYEPFKLVSYELCFACHNQAAVSELQTATATNFRDDRQNLHYVHVNRADKGRTCRTCHDSHASNLPHLMASSVPFEGGGWAMPINFEPTPSGGRCSPGCHAPREYRRSAAVLAPAATSVPADVRKVRP